MDGNDVAGDDHDPIWNGVLMDLSWYYYNGYVAMVDPFHVDLVSSSSVSGGGDVVDDYFWGRDCIVEDDEWCHICQEVVVLDAPFPRTMDAFMSFVYDVIVAAVQAAVVGIGYDSQSRMMGIVIVYPVVGVIGGEWCSLVTWRWFSSMVFLGGGLGVVGRLGLWGWVRLWTWLIGRGLLKCLAG